MHNIIYKFIKRPEVSEERFLEAAANMAALLKKRHGSLGARTHRSEEPNVYIAYAQWPSKAVRDACKLSTEEELGLEKALQECCSSISQLYALELVLDCF